jgi:precorrin-6B methylase 2
MALSRGFMVARVLLTGAELDVWTEVRDSPTLQSLADRLGADPRALEILLDSLVSIGWLTKSGDHYANTPESEVWLTMDSEESALPYLRHMASLWDLWSGLTTKVLACASRWDGTDRQQAFIEAMHVLAQHRAERTIAKLRPHESSSLLDVGGGSGTYSIAFLRSNPEARATIFDLPGVAEMAATRLEREGLSHRGRVVPGDFQSDPLPAGHDLILFSAVLHMNGPDENVRLLRKCRRALAPNGRLVVRDHLMSEDRTSPTAGALFAVNMLVATEHGRTYSLGELTSLLNEADFSDPTILDRPGTMDDLIEAKPL